MANKQKQQAALEALMQSSTLTEAADKAGIDRKTLYRYIHTDADFAEAYKEEQAAKGLALQERLQQAEERAIDILLGIAESEEAQPSARCKAVQLLLEHTAKQREIAREAMASNNRLFDELLSNNGSSEAGYRKLLNMQENM